MTLRLLLLRAAEADSATDGGALQVLLRALRAGAVQGAHAGHAEHAARARRRALRRVARGHNPRGGHAAAE